MSVYSFLLPIGITTIACSVSFFLGVIFAQTPYTHRLLFSIASNEEFDAALHNYQLWANLSPLLLSVLGLVTAAGFIGCLVLIYKPTETSKLYDYTIFGCFFLAICIVITNVKTGLNATVVRKWGEVDEHTGLNVLGASLFFIVLFLLGCLLMLLGRHYQVHVLDPELERLYQIELKKFNEKLQKEEEEKAKEENTGKNGGVKKSKKKSAASKKQD